MTRLSVAAATYSPAWAAQLLNVLRLFAEHEQEGRPAPTRFDAYVALDLRAESFAAARTALLKDGRLHEVASRRRRGPGPAKPCTLTPAGWSALGTKPPTPTSRGPRVRRCLGCGQHFDSWGAGNRLCPRCLSRDALAGGGGLAW